MGLDVWCYTGYTFEELLNKANHIPAIREFLNTIDVLVDGKFIFEEKSYDAVFRGSKNQRLIDVKSSLDNNSVIEVSKYNSSNKKNTQKTRLYI